MKVPRPFSIADFSDMASPRVRDGPQVWLGVLKRDSCAGFVLANRGQPPRTSATEASSPTHGLAPITPGGCASRGGPSRATGPSKHPKELQKARTERRHVLPTAGQKTDNNGITR